MMKKKALLFFLCCTFLAQLQAQVVNTGQTVHIDNGGLLFIEDGYFHVEGTVSGNGSIELKGDWDNRSSGNVIETGSEGTVTLSGGSQYIKGNKTLFSNLVLTGKGDKTLEFDTDVSGVLDLGDKNLHAQRYTLSILNPDANAITRTSGFITTDDNGILLRNTNKTDAYLFPLGSVKNNPSFANLNAIDVNPLYRPLTVTPDDAQFNVFSATLSNYDPNAQFLRVNKSTDLGSISDKYFYILNQDFGVSKSSIRFFQNSGVDNNSVIVNWSRNLSTWEKQPTKISEGAFGDRLNKSLEFYSAATLKNVPVTFANAISQSNPFTFYNAFSPDGDGKNDTWQIKNIESYPDNTLTVFNRWGDEVFKSVSYSNANAWSGNNLSSGTYFYLLSVKINGQQKTFKGFITMIKND